jgi:hypothetical protein
MGDGGSCNYSVHHVDVARWLIGETLPRRVMSIGGRFGWVDAGDVPNAQATYYDFESAPILYLLRNMPKAKNPDRFTLHVHCEGGMLVIPGSSGAVRGGTAYDRGGKPIRTFSGGDENHFVNFVKAVRSRRPEDLNGSILEGHLSTAVTHLGNISYRVGEKMSIDEIRERIQGDYRAQALFARAFFGDMVEHVQGNGVDLSGKSITMGPWLDFDIANERFVNHDRANQLVRGFYRDPFTVPEVTV